MVPPAVRCGRGLRRRLAPLVARAGATPGADRSRKHFPAVAHLGLLLVHVLDGTASPRQTRARLAAIPGLFPRLGLHRGLSRSQLARSSTSRDPACFERLFAPVVARARSTASRDPRWRALTKVQAVDSTFLRLTAKLSPWGVHGGHAPGVRLHVGFDLADAVPVSLLLTGTEAHDAGAFDRRALTEVAGWTALGDLGYYGHARFARLVAAGVSFPCPLHPQATYRVTAAHPVPPLTPPDGDVVLADQTLTLGSPNNRAGTVAPGLRLVTSRNPAGAERRFVTDRFDLAAADVVALYRKRWQIELFFRWLKHQLQAIHPFGTSRAAVWLTVLVCAIVAVVLGMVAADRPAGQSHIEWLRGVAAACQAAFTNTS